MLKYCFLNIKLTLTALLVLFVIITWFLSSHSTELDGKSSLLHSKPPYISSKAYLSQIAPEGNQLKTDDGTPIAGPMIKSHFVRDIKLFTKFEDEARADPDRRLSNPIDSFVAASSFQGISLPKQDFQDITQQLADQGVTAKSFLEHRRYKSALPNKVLAFKPEANVIALISAYIPVDAPQKNGGIQYQHSGAIHYFIIDQNRNLISYAQIEVDKLFLSFATDFAGYCWLYLDKTMISIK